MTQYEITVEGRRYRTGSLALGDYETLLELATEADLPLTFDLTGDGAILFYAGRLLENLLAKKLITRFFQVILKPADQDTPEATREQDIRAMSEEQALEVLQHFFETRAEFIMRLVASSLNWTKLLEKMITSASSEAFLNRSSSTASSPIARAS